MKLLVTLIATLVAFAGGLAHADNALVATLEARKVVRAADGTEKFVAADTTRPDDVLEYRTTYRNQSPKTLRGVAATLPVPAGFQYLPDTAGPTKVEASLDGRTYAAVPLKRIVKAKDGTDRTEIVPAHEYRFLRWSLGDLTANATSTVVARMRFTDAPASLAAVQ